MQTLFRRLLFDYWYYRQPPWDTGISPPELLEFIETHKPGRAIDIGCGTGTNVITLATAGWKVTGVDFAPRAIKLAHQKLNKANVQAELFVKDATRLGGINGPFDLAFDLGCFHSLPHDAKPEYVKQLNRVLTPNGFWLMYGFLNSDTGHARHGLSEGEIQRISAQLTMLSRQDGYDDHGQKSSAWFLFQKQPQIPT